MFTAFLLLGALCSTSLAKVYRRVVVLSPAAADVLHRLGVDELVVGKTKSVKLFPKAVSVGSHIRPNVEIVASLKADLVIASSERFFSKSMAERVGADFYLYNPVTLEEILVHIKRLGSLLGRGDRAKKLCRELEDELKKVKPVTVKPRVIYEVMQRPYMVAGRKNIVADIIERAGGIYVVKAFRKLVRTSCERIRLLKPDVYVYQVGPMNKNPDPPRNRPCLKGIRFHQVKVNELAFARANTKSFYNVLWLNKLFHQWEQSRAR